MGIKEGTCCDEYWVLYVNDESLNSTPETNIALMLTKIKIKEKKDKMWFPVLEKITGISMLRQDGVDTSLPNPLTKYN